MREPSASPGHAAEPPRWPTAWQHVAVLVIALTVVVATAAGIAVERRDNVLAQRLRQLILRLMLWALLPFAALVNLNHVDLSFDASAAIVAGFAATALAGVLAWRLGDGPFRLPRPRTGAMIVSTLQANSGYLGLPICAVLFSEAELAQAVAYDALTSTPMLVLGSFSVGAVFGGSANAGWRARLRVLLLNPVLPTTVAALALPRSFVPEELIAPSHIAIYSLLPLGFLIVGITLGDESKEGVLRFPPPLTPPIAAVIVLRMAFVPVVLALLALLVLDVPTPFLLLAAMPVGINTLVVAHATRLDLGLPSAAIAWSTGLALVGVLAIALVRTIS